MVLILAGIGIVTPGFMDLLLAFLRLALGVQAPPVVPWWVGLILIGGGILVFLVGVFGAENTQSGTASRLAFRINASNGIKRLHRLKPSGSIRIGRSRDNDLIIKDDYVSRHHCVVIVRNDHVEINDLNAHNITKINGVKARSGLINVNESFSIGATEFVLVRVGS
jgi:hypothetical protein